MTVADYGDVEIRHAEWKVDRPPYRPRRFESRTEQVVSEPEPEFRPFPSGTPTSETTEEYLARIGPHLAPEIRDALAKTAGVCDFPASDDFNLDDDIDDLFDA